ncbi:MAG: isoprenylcysteine carboxylmethyltransferase family protein [Flavobacteriales bacterium]|nr:isoprenylcysteine carboxylmethyltransferase family protein [Flavobacteriales bacterium]
MRKLPSILLLLSLLYLVPLLGAPTLLLSWPVLFAATLCTLLLATQPVIDAKETQEHRNTDCNTLWLILGVSALGQVACLLEWAYVREASQTFTPLAIGGSAVMLTGMILRYWSIRTLDRAFSATVRIKEGQQLITSGPYRLLRHPSYTGAWLVFVGVALLFHSWAGLLIMGPGMFWVYTRRIATEERTLEAAFGEAYREMKNRTWRMVPGW